MKLERQLQEIEKRLAVTLLLIRSRNPTVLPGGHVEFDRPGQQGFLGSSDLDETPHPTAGRSTLRWSWPPNPSAGGGPNSPPRLPFALERGKTGEEVIG